MFKKAKNQEGDAILHELRKVYEFMQEHQLETVEYQQKGTQMRLVRKRSPQVPVPVMQYAAAPAGGAAPAAARAAAPQFTGDSIKSPLMGIFYRGSTPSSPPFIKEGETVKAGQVLCLIEAMKVFNEIKAEFDCEVTKVLVDNGKPVKVGQDIFAVKKL